MYHFISRNKREKIPHELWCDAMIANAEDSRHSRIYSVKEPARKTTPAVRHYTNAELKEMLAKLSA